MNRYPLTTTVGACIGGVVLIVLAVAAAVVLLRRRRDSHRQQPKAAQEEESVEVHATAQRVSLCETQPLLNESAIRTRYAASPTEYAQSFIGSLPNSTLGAPQSPSRTLGRSPCNAAQHIIAVTVTDSSDSEDSGIDSSDEEPDPVSAVAFHGRPELGRSPYYDTIGTASLASALGVSPGVHYATAGRPSGSTEHNGEPTALASEAAVPTDSSNVIAPTVIEEYTTPNSESDKFMTEADDSSQSGEPMVSECLPNMSPEPQPEPTTPATTTTCTAEPDTDILAPQHQQPESVDSPCFSSSQVNTLRDNDSRSRSSSAGEQGAEADLPRESTTQATGSDAKPFKRRCRFWPTCSNGKCKYTHPQEKCHMHPNCAFGVSCIYVHPGDVQKINAVIAGKGARRAKRKNDIIKFNHLESYMR